MKFNFIYKNSIVNSEILCQKYEYVHSAYVHNTEVAFIVNGQPLHVFFLDKFIFYFLFLIPCSTDSVELVNPNNGELTELEEVKSYEKPEDSTNICYQG